MLIPFLSVGASFGQSGFASGGFAKMDVAAAAEDDRLCVAKDGGNLKASGTLNVHKVTIRGLHEALELVRVEFLFGAGV